MLDLRRICHPKPHPFDVDDIVTVSISCSVMFQQLRFSARFTFQVSKGILRKCITQIAVGSKLRPRSMPTMNSREARA